MADYDFKFLCAAFEAWFVLQGFSQARLEDADGPSAPVQKRLIDGDWTSSRPSEVTKKIDAGFEWPPGTAWRVLTEQYDPVGDHAFLSQYVQGKRRSPQAAKASEVDPFEIDDDLEAVQEFVRQRATRRATSTGKARTTEDEARGTGSQDPGGMEGA